METISLPASPRSLDTKAKKIRSGSAIPAEYYGAGQPNLHLVLDYQTFRKVYKNAGRSSIVNLQVEGESKPREILIHKVTYDPLTDKFQHVDLKQINRSHRMITTFEIHLVGISPAVKDHGGILTQNKHEIEVKCLPGDFMKALEVDISNLKEIGNSIHVSDLPLDKKKFEILEKPETQVVTVLAPKTQDELDAELATPVGDAVSEDLKQEAEAAKAAALASKESDTEKKGRKE
jgi:large subunit ribosomal protein L25